VPDSPTGDGSGEISRNEFEGACKQMGFTDADEPSIRKALKKLDTNGDGVISFPEFILLIGKKLRSDLTDGDMLEAFRVFDRDGNNHITLEELFLVRSGTSCSCQ